ncbi:MAG: hypothetical protein ACFFD4_10710 [Candidatus Odinarchaeota archaeon]
MFLLSPSLFLYVVINRSSGDSCLISGFIPSCRITGPISEKKLVTRLPASVTTIRRRLAVLAERGIVEILAVRGSRGKILAFWYLKPANEHEHRILKGQLEQLKERNRHQD